MSYKFIVEDEDQIVYEVEKPTLEMLEEEMGRWERYKENND